MTPVVRIGERTARDPEKASKQLPVVWYTGIQKCTYTEIN